MLFRTYYYTFFYFLTHNIVNNICFKHIRYVRKYGNVLSRKKGGESYSCNFLKKECYCYKHRFLQEENKRGALYIEAYSKEEGNIGGYAGENMGEHIGENMSVRHINMRNHNKGYKHMNKELFDKLKKKRLIINFKKYDNILNSRNFKNRFINLLSYCGKVKKLDYINFYLYNFFANVNERLLNICLLLLSSQRIQVEFDYKIRLTEEKNFTMNASGQHNVSNMSTDSSLCAHCDPMHRFFTLSNKLGFKKHMNRLRRGYKGTNIFEGYDETKIKEGIELSIPYEKNDVHVCIVDTGIDYNHVDLKNNIIVIKQFERKNNKNYEKSKGNNEDKNKDRYTDRNEDAEKDSYNYSEKHPSSDLDNSIDGHGHGTFIAGIIAGNSPKNNNGIRGISKRAKLIICKALNNNNAGNISDILECFNFCAKKRAKIINASFASTNNYPSLYKALKELQEKNVLVISSSGNCNSQDDSKNTFTECNLNVKKLYPPAYSVQLHNLIVVSNMIQEKDSHIYLSPDSCYSNNYVHLAAPGNNIISTFPSNKYAISSGSSFSAAVITGLASIIFSINSKLTNEQVIQIFRSSIVQAKSLKDKVKWGGYLNVYNLVKYAIEHSTHS
ncbi:subtilisin-like protease 3, putative [Plasmodium malariae]|uniref:subtilisin n=1 Tax=Plasmodium malariae TaxID=5858 RepID=A0A1C3KB04_PLAMA|nr:subtilisin-like protease 3, putative [Plasmodium malariae]